VTHHKAYILAVARIGHNQLTLILLQCCSKLSANVQLHGDSRLADRSGPLLIYPGFPVIQGRALRSRARGKDGQLSRSLSFLVTARGASAAFGEFGFALKTAATFDVFYRLQVTNYGVLYVLFDSPPSGSNPIDVWDLRLHIQMAFPQRF
jgi:hypothetical protein